MTLPPITQWLPCPSPSDTFFCPLLQEPLLGLPVSTLRSHYPARIIFLKSVSDFVSQTSDLQWLSLCRNPLSFLYLGSAPAGSQEVSPITHIRYLHLYCHVWPLPLSEPPPALGLQMHPSFCMECSSSPLLSDLLFTPWAWGLMSLPSSGWRTLQPRRLDYTSLLQPGAALCAFPPSCYHNAQVNYIVICIIICVAGIKEQLLSSKCLHLLLQPHALGANLVRHKASALNPTLRFWTLPCPPHSHHPTPSWENLPGSNIPLHSLIYLAN